MHTLTRADGFIGRALFEQLDLTEANTLEFALDVENENG